MHTVTGEDMIEIPNDPAARKAWHDERERRKITFNVQVTVQLVNQDGEVMNNRGVPSHLNKDGRLEKAIELATGAVGIEAGIHDFQVVADRIGQM
jgi:hypothetical protein